MPQIRTANPLCPRCGRSMNADADGRVFWCPKCAPPLEDEDRARGEGTVESRTKSAVEWVFFKYAFGFLAAIVAVAIFPVDNVLLRVAISLGAGFVVGTLLESARRPNGGRTAESPRDATGADVRKATVAFAVLIGGLIVGVVALVWVINLLKK